MNTIVMKFGGTSVADVEKIHAAATRAVTARKKGHRVAVVVSAMGKETDRLVDLASQISKAPPHREMDQLLVAGEQVTIALMAMAIEQMGHQAISMTGGQIGIVTDEAHTKARIRSIDVQRLNEHLDAGRIVIVAGFQGVTTDGHITTLGRGGSNVTLVAIAAALSADECDNFTDVDGIFTADPRVVPNARKVEAISYDEMLELASLGANVLHHRAVEFAKKYDVPLHVRNSGHNRKGTLIVHETESMERIVVRGVALKDELARVTLSNTPDQPGIAAKVFHRIASHDVVVDDIIQTTAPDGTATISFTVDLAELPECRKVVAKLCKELDCSALYEDHLAKVSAVGVGMRTHTGVAERMFESLAKANVNIQNITTSEIKISCLIEQKQGKKALRTIHEAFDLGTDAVTDRSVRQVVSGRRKKAAKKTKKSKNRKKASKKTATSRSKKTAKKHTKKAARPKDKQS
ncbi:MAG: aspartate kinase [Planctomycetes bacterium]|jgi:aspartate kinase|nr:aspartate kinase [Planctomycetota bacterium]